MATEQTTYASADFAKCSGNPTRSECNDCLRMTLPIHPNTTRQVWIGFWVLEEPCPHKVVALPGQQL